MKKAMKVTITYEYDPNYNNPCFAFIEKPTLIAGSGKTFEEAKQVVLRLYRGGVVEEQKTPPPEDIEI